MSMVNFYGGTRRGTLSVRGRGERVGAGLPEKGGLQMSIETKGNDRTIIGLAGLNCYSIWSSLT